MPSISKSAFSRTAGITVAVLFGFPSISHAEPGLMLGVDGVGTLAASGFDLQELRANHREYQWEQADRMTESVLQRAVIAHRGSTPVLTVVDDGAGRISHIEIVDPEVGNWLGPRIATPTKHFIAICSWVPANRAWNTCPARLSAKPLRHHASPMPFQGSGMARMGNCRRRRSSKAGPCPRWYGMLSLAQRLPSQLRLLQALTARIPSGRSRK